MRIYGCQMLNRADPMAVRMLGQEVMRRFSPEAFRRLSDRLASPVSRAEGRPKNEFGDAYALSAKTSADQSALVGAPCIPMLLVILLDYRASGVKRSGSGSTNRLAGAPD